MSDRDDIADVLIRYATGVDSKNWPLFRTCFTDDVHADYGDIGVWDGVDAIATWMERTHAAMPATNHMITNIAVELDGDRARATSYVHAVLAITPDSSQFVDAVGSYHDTLVRTPDGWRIRERRFVSTRQAFL
jgi:3-phenylpropionate/cinnamic acid dioxygenase small subunit